MADDQVNEQLALGELPEAITQSSAAPDSTWSSASPSPLAEADLFQPSGLNVRAEEVGLVFLVLLLWAGAVALFFNRWGKIRMLEPYQPKFSDVPRPSLANVMANSGNPAVHRPSFPAIELGHQSRAYSRLNIASWCDTTPPSGLGPRGDRQGLPGRKRASSVFVPHGMQLHGQGMDDFGHCGRGRLDSVSSLAACHFLQTTRRVKSAFDIQTLVLKEETEEALCSFTTSEASNKNTQETTVLMTSV